MYICNHDNCQFKTKKISDFHSHIYVHIENGDTISCPYNLGCKRNVMFTNVNSLKSHIFRDHKNLAYENEQLVVNDDKQNNLLTSIDLAFQSSHDTDKNI